MHNLNELKVYGLAMEIAEMAYRMAAQLPNDEKYGLSSQIKRSAVSIPSNIAEGSGRWGDGEFLQFLSIANGSSTELHTQIQLAVRLGFLNVSDCREILSKLLEMQKMLFSQANHPQKTKHEITPHS